MVPMTNEQAQRERLLDPRVDSGVSAGAGAGKTKNLVDRYVNLLVEGREHGIKASNILALTFTDKAAAEMMDRVRDEVLKHRKEDGWKEIADELDWSNVQTIHSFCSDVIRRFALECGVAPDFQVLDENAMALLMNDGFTLLMDGGEDIELDKAIVRLTVLGPHVSNNFLKSSLEFLYEKRMDVRDWMNRYGSKESLTRTYADLANGPHRNARYQGLMFNASYSRGLSILLRTVNEIISSGKGENPRASDEIRKRLIDLRDRSSINDLDSYADMMARLGTLLQEFTPAKIIKLENNEALNKQYNYYRTKITNSLKRTSMESTIDDHKCSASVLEDLWMVYQKYERIVDGLKADRMVIGFDDMINKIYALLQNDKRVRDHLSRRYRHILIDELQDTDHHQIGILEALLEDWPDGKLFAVGDRKQSIYRFRKAEVEQFDHVLDMISKKRGKETEELRTNYRSTKEVIDFVNTCFRPIIQNGDTEYQRMELSQKRSGDKGSIELLMVRSADEGDWETSTAEIQADLIADRIRHVMQDKKMVYMGKDGKHSPVGRPPEYRDFAILISTRTHLKEIETALAKRKVPYHVHKGIGFFDRQEVNDVFSLLRFLQDPADDVALVGLLRSPFVCLKDQEILTVRQERGWCLWSIISKLMGRDDVPSPLKEVIDRCRQLSRWLDEAERWPVSEVLSNILNDSGAIPVYAGANDGDQVLGNIHKAIENVRTMEAMGIGGLDDIVRQMELIMEANKKEGQAPLDLETGDTVKIMTVHAAKGLEFPIVIVPFLERNWNEKPPNSGKGVDIDFDPDIGLGLNRPSRKGMRVPDNIFSVVEASEDRKDQAEHGRQFYVATTRAMDHLILIGRREVRDFGVDTSWMTMMMRSLPELRTIEGRGSINMEDGTRINVEWIETKDVERKDEREPISLIESGAVGTIVPWAKAGREDRSEVLTATMLKEHLYDDGVNRQITIRSLMQRTAPSDKDAKTLGTAVHEVLRGRDIDTVLKEHELDLPRSAMEDVRERFLSSELMNEVTTDLRELPFQAIVNGHRFGGIMDRLVRHSDGSWSVIDYKTDRSAGNDDEVQKKHGLQLFLYSKAASTAMGSSVSRNVYLTQENKGVEVDERGGEELQEELTSYDAHEGDGKA